MNGRIVIVDDEPITRLDIRDIVIEAGYEVVGEAADGFEAIEVCKLTLKENNIEANIINEDFTLWNNDTKFDVIVSNPPYFDSRTIKQRNENKFIELARHEGTLNLSSLCENIAKHLSINGRAYLVYRPIRLNDLEKSLNENNLYIKEYQFVYDTRKKEAKSVLVEITFNQCEKVQLEDQYI